MNKVATINLNGRAYQIEEEGYDALRKYLDGARAKLAENPDASEIMADFEQAIADKCDARLSPRKNVVTAVEIDEIIKTMGPVDVGTSGAEHHGASAAKDNTASAGAAPKRLYRLPEGEWIAGVSTGLAAYFNIDVTVVRVLFVLLAIFTHGFGVLAYVLFWIVMPVARTESERAQAHGVAPFSAHEFIEQAKSRYEEFRQNHPDVDKKSWKDWKRERKTAWREERMKAHMAWHNSQNEPSYGAGSGFFRFIMGLIIAALFVFWIMALWSVLTYGTLFGYAIAAGHPGWIAIVFVCALFYALALPFKVLMRNARPWKWGHYSFFNDLMQSIVFVFALYLVLMLGRELFPAVNQAYATVVTYLQSGL